MSGRGVPFGELSPDAQRAVRRRLPELGPNSPLLPGLVTDRIEGAIKARRRVRSGQWFEKELEADHAVYRRRGLAVIYRRAPLMVKAGGEWKHARGKAPVDFSGPVRDLGTVVFDAKSWGAATYVHEPQQYHQLEELRDVQRLSTPTAPTRAFLLIACRPLGIAYLVEPLAPLLERAPIVLRSAKPGRRRTQAGTVEGFVHYYPFLTRLPDLLAMQDGLRWDWLPLLR